MQESRMNNVNAHVHTCTLSDRRENDSVLIMHCVYTMMLHRRHDDLNTEKQL